MACSCTSFTHAPLIALQGQTLGFEFAAALVLGRELDDRTRDMLSQHYANVLKSFFCIPVSFFATVHAVSVMSEPLPDPLHHELTAIRLCQIAHLCSSSSSSIQRYLSIEPHKIFNC